MCTQKSYERDYNLNERLSGLSRPHSISPRIRSDWIFQKFVIEFFFFFFEKRRSNASFGKSIKRANRCPHEMYHVYLISNHANYNLNKFYIEDAIKAAAAAPVDTSKLIAFCVSDAIGGARTFSMPPECGLVNWSAAAFAN